MKYLQLLAIFVVALLMNSCATILTGTTQRVTIDSTPQGASIVVDGRLMGTTPAKVRLERDLNALIDDGKDIRLEMDGYYPDGYYLGTDIEPVCILNVFCPVGFALDAVTGAIMRYDSDYYNFLMVPMETAPDNTVAAPMDTDDSSAQAETEDDYEKLMKLVELYEEGKLTKEEYEVEKAKLFEK